MEPRERNMTFNKKILVIIEVLKWINERESMCCCLVGNWSKENNGES